MRSLILIVAYLSKDIFKRWLETPGAVFARVLIATSLCLLFLFMQAGFSLTERAVKKKISSFGLNTLILRTTEVNSQEHRPQLDELFSGLADKGIYFPFSVLYAKAQLQGNKKAKVVIYKENSLPVLKSFFPIERIRSQIFLTAHGYQESLPERVRIWNYFYDAEVIKPSPQLRFISHNEPMLFIPESVSRFFQKFSRQESILFLAQESGELPQIISSIENLLKQEGFERFEITSPIKWLGELDGVRSLRVQAQAIGGSFVGLLIILIFGSIAIFEYRQNIFATALFKSFGLHAIHLIFRYFFEALLLLFISFIISIELAKILHGVVFKLAGFDSGLLFLSSFNPYQISENYFLVSLLAFTAGVSIMPVCFALRKPVGRVLG